MPHSHATTRLPARVGPDGPVLGERPRRARTERMAVRPLGAGRYEVAGASGIRYLVSLADGWCTCPDYLMRGARCKHLHRVAIEMDAGTVPSPDKQLTLCAGCDAETAVDSAADPPLCAHCRLSPGDVVLDRQTGDPLVVVEVLDARADEVEIPEADSTVADYPANRGYPPRDPVVRVVYPGSVRAVTRAPRPPKRYAFPISRLRRLDASETTANQSLDGRSHQSRLADTR